MTATGHWEIHPLALDFPVMTNRERRMLELDVAANGVIQPILLLEHEGQEKVVDGRHRVAAAAAAGIPPEDIPAVRLAPDTPPDEVQAIVRSRNLALRHLTQSQRAIIAARLPRLSHGGARRSSDQPRPWNQPTEARRERAAAYGISVGQLRRADFLVSSGSQELIDAVFAGRLALSRAEAIARGEVEEQDERGRPWLTHAAARVDAALSDIAAALTADPALADAAAATVDRWAALLVELQQLCAEKTVAAPNPPDPPVTG